MKENSTRKKNFQPELECTCRLMPSDTYAEECVIGAIMIEKQAVETATALLTPDMFYSDINRIIFSAIAAMYEARINIDALTLVDRLTKDGKLENIGGYTHISELLVKVISSMNLEQHCMIVRECHIRRRMIELSMMETESGFDKTMDVEDVISQINTGIEEIQELIVGKNDITHISTPLMQSVNNMTGRVVDYKAGKTTPGITTGFADLNRLTGGFKPSRLIIIAARPGCGKTAIAIHFAMKAATEGKNVVFFTLEMENTELTDRILIRESGVDAERFNSGGIEFKEIERVLDSMEKTKRLPVYIEDSARMSVQQIVNRARMLHKQGRCNMVIIDYIQLITTPANRNRNREQEVSEISRSLKLAAKEMKIPFIVLCQMNREFDKEKNREPRLSDIRESGSIEQDADMVIFIHRPQAGENRIELCIKKHRAGKLGKIAVTHNDSMTNFFDMDYRNQDAYVKQATYIPGETGYRDEMPF